MNVTFVFFAQARELVGASQLTRQLPEGSTLLDAKQNVLQLHPELAGLFAHCTFAVNREYSQDATELSDGCEIGCIPPVSGG